MLNDAESARPGSRRGVSLRAVALGVICCLAIAAGEPYGVLMMQSSPMAADYSTGAALFPGELIRAPRAWAEQRYPNLVHWREFERGGHFAAFEVPELLAEDLRTFFRPYRSG